MIRFWARSACWVVVAVAANLGRPAPAIDMTSGEELRRVAELVSQLGDTSFSVRQRATKQLVEIGIVGQPLLTRALESDDAEVRSRAAQVLAQVLESDFRDRLEAFASDTAGTTKHTLPCWNEFQAVFGTDKNARALFVEMQRSEPGLLEALAQDRRTASDLLHDRTQAIFPQTQWAMIPGGSPAAIPMGSICALLFLGSNSEVSVTEPDAIQVSNLIHQGSFQTALRAAAYAPLMRKLLGNWILQNSVPSIAYHNLRLACDNDLKEGLELALRMLAGDGGGQPFVKQYVILTIGRFGNAEHISRLEPLLKDATPCMPQQNDARQSQIRDVALAVLIKLSGQELKDYGLAHVQASSQTLYQPGSIVFTDPAQRDRALKKWAEWARQDRDDK